MTLAEWNRKRRESADALLRQCHECTGLPWVTWLSGDKLAVSHSIERNWQMFLRVFEDDLRRTYTASLKERLK